MQKILSLLAHPAAFILAVLILASFFIFVLPAESEKAAVYTPEEGAFDLTFYYPPSAVYGLIEAYGDYGRSAYIHSRLTFDLAYPLVYTFFCLTGISFFLKRLNWKKPVLLVIPLSALVFDLIENTSISIMMAAWPDRLPVLPWIASLGTLMKWITVVPSVGMVPGLAVIYLFRRRIRKRSQPGG